MGRTQQKKETRITVRMDTRLARKIERYAKREDLELAETVRRMVRAFLNGAAFSRPSALGR